MDYRNKIPFYMTYPMQNMYLTEMEYEKDMERMKELYPREVHQLQKMVEKRCDEMEYDGSRMYDENPDRYMLEEESRRLYEQFIRENPQYSIMMPQQEQETDRRQLSSPQKFGISENFTQEDMQMQQRGRGCENSWLCSLISILFHDEIYRRRCRNRRCRRWW